MKYLLRVLLLFTVLTAHAQVVTTVQPTPSSTFNPPGCFTDVLHNIKLQNTPGYNNTQLLMDNSIRQALGTSANRAAIFIPVVVHVIHNNGPENISVNQVLTAIQHLNDAFANTGAFNQPDGVNANIQFCLAKQDPNGVYTTGITYTVSPLTDVTVETQDLDLKNLIRWDPTRYLNIWVVREISSLSVGAAVAGYAYFPSSHGQPDDGIVCEAGLFGTSADNSKVHIHEAGHYLGLYHTFQGGCYNNDCLNDGDHVCDTPPDNSAGAVFCADTPNTCSSDDDDLSTNNPFRPIANGGLGDQPDMFENYMDYGFQICQNVFTQGQSTRMLAALATQRASLLQSEGCNSVCFSLINMNYSTTTTNIAIGGSVTLTMTAPTNGATYTWAQNGINFGTGTSITRTFNNTGTYTITVTGTNSQVACTQSQTIIVVVSCNAQATFTLSPNSPYHVGATITATSTSVNATTYAWYLDGVLVGNTPTYTRQYNISGGHNLSLIVANNLCADTSATAFFDVGDCTLEGMNANWVMSYKRLNFSSLGIGVGGSPMANWQQEAVSTISDPDGNMLFTTDGITVWDANFNVMPNGTGLMGHYSSTQGVLASPYPGSNNLYYIFTTDGTENNMGANGFRYSIIDMSLNGGMGDVVATKKNILLRNTVCEKLTGTYHANGRDIWITVAGQNSRSYYSYLLTPAGIDTTPVVSTIGTVNNDILGGMKYSHDGNKVAACVVNGASRQLVIANFNKATGQMFGDFSISYASIYQPYSVEFSPDNSKLYISFWNRNHVFQYNLAAGSNTAIQASEIRVDTYGATPPPIGQLALANNGKIYIFSSMSNALDVINNPNSAGAACGYTSGVFPFSAMQGSIGLQNIITGLDQPHNPKITGPAKLCLGGAQHQYIIPYATATDVVSWTYTGPGTFTANANNTATITTGNTPGTGRITVMLTSSCGITYDTLYVSTVVPDEVFIGNDTAFCNTLNLHAQHPFTTYQWSTGSTNDTIAVTTAGNYWVNVTDANGCASTDTIALVTNPPILPVTITATGTICASGVVVLNAGPGYNSYEWQDGFPEQSTTVFQPGTYWVTVRNGCSVDTDSITINSGFGSIQFNLAYNGDSVLCGGSLPITLNGPSGYAGYNWNNNTTASTLQINTPGKYWLTVTDGNGCTGTDTFRVVNTTVPDFQVTYNGNTVACGATFPALLFGPQGYSYYDWGNGNNFYVNVVFDPGVYTLTVYDTYGCSATDSISVNQGGASQPIYLNYNGDSIVCADALPFTLSAPAGFANYQWQDSSTNSSLQVTQPGIYWVAVNDSCSNGRDTLIVRPSVNFELVFNGDTTACKNALPFTLNAPAGYQQYFWQNGNGTAVMQVNNVGTYWVRVSDTEGCTGVDTFRVVDCVGIDELNAQNIKIYPNPSINMVKIEVEIPANVAIFNIAGQKVLSQQISGNAVLPINHIASGLYLVEVSTSKGLFRQKLIISH